MKHRALLLFFLAAIAVTNSAFGTTLVRMSLEQLSQAATEIVRGRVVSQESRWNPEHTRIVTLTSVAVDQVMKGAPPSTVVVQQLGGTVGNIRVRVAGTVPFHTQGDYLLFLETANPERSRFLVVGMRQGAYQIYHDATTHEERVIRPFYNLYEGGQGPAGSGQTMPFSGFRQQISSALQTPLVIPRGTSMTLTIASTESRGVGRLHVQGRTAFAVYPNAAVVIPAGSIVEGTAQLDSGLLRIHWTELSVRGTRVAISATSEEPRGEALHGKTLVVKVR